MDLPGRLRARREGVAGGWRGGREQKVGVEVNLVAEFEAELSRVRAQLVQLQGSRPDPET